TLALHGGDQRGARLPATDPPRGAARDRDAPRAPCRPDAPARPGADTHGGVGAGAAPGEPAGGHRPSPVRGILLQGDRRAPRRDGDGREGTRPPGLRTAAHAAGIGEGTRMSECDRFFEALASDRLDDSAREHARGCQVCSPLLPGDRPPDSPPGPTLEAVRSRALEALRTTPLRPWARDAVRIAFLQAAVAVGVSVLLGARNWSSPLARHMALAAVGAVLLVVVTLGSVLALAPGRRGPRWMLVLIPVVPALLVLSGNGMH